MQYIEIIEESLAFLGRRGHGAREAPVRPFTDIRAHDAAAPAFNPDRSCWAAALRLALRSMPRGRTTKSIIEAAVASGAHVVFKRDGSIEVVPDGKPAKTEIQTNEWDEVLEGGADETPEIH